VFITAGPSTKLFTWGGEGVCFITAGPITKLCVKEGEKKIGAAFPSFQREGKTVF
jgi:hypothetical protein